MKKMKQLSFSLFGLLVIFFSFSCRKPEAPAPDPHKLTQPYYIQFDLIKENGDSSRVTVQWSDHGSYREETYFDSDKTKLTEEIIGGKDNEKYDVGPNSIRPIPVRLIFFKNFENSKPDTLPIDSVISLYTGESMIFDPSAGSQRGAYLQVNGHRANENGLEYLDIGNYCNSSNTDNTNSVLRFTEIAFKKTMLSKEKGGALRYFREYYMEVKGNFQCNLLGNDKDKDNQYPVYKIKNGKFSSLVAPDKAWIPY